MVQEIGIRNRINLNKMKNYIKKFMMEMKLKPDYKMKR